jgi:tetratricopeptide (TPR) repeat protein
MYCSFFGRLRYLQACFALLLGYVVVQAQDTPSQLSKPLNLDKELEEKVTPDLAVSYYHFSLSKIYEDKGDLARALSEMQTALKYNPNSSAVHLEIASLLERSGNISQAIDHAQEAVRLDPLDPDPHWLLANIYFRTSVPGSSAEESRKKAIGELEKLTELTPSDERIHFALGGAYFEMDEPEKAIKSYEAFQNLSPSTDAGFKEIAKYYGRSGNIEKAIEYLIKGLNAQPDSPESLSLLQSLYLKLNKNKEEIPVYKKLLELSQNSITVSRQIAPLLVETGEYDDAIDLLNNLIKALPMEKAFPILLGRAQIGLRKFPEAIATLQSVVATDPNAIEARYYLGRAYLEAGKYNEAASTLNDLIKVMPSDKSSRILLGRAQLGLRKLSEAIATFQSIVEADPEATEAQFYLGTTYIEIGKYTKAIEVFSHLLEKATDESSANRHLFQQRLAVTYQELGEYEKAIALYQELAKTEPDANSSLLEIYRLSRQFDKGISLGKQLCEKNPGDMPVCISYAYLLADADNSKEGIEILSKMLQENPQNINIYIHLSRLYLVGKRYGDAEKIIRQAEEQKLDEENLEKLKFQRATIYERQKEFARAESIFKEILKANPTNAVVLNYLGYMLADQGLRLEEAMRYIKEALVIDPYSGAYLDSLGWVFFKMNDMESAEKYLLQAREIVRNDPTIDDHLGDLYFKTGNLKKANEFWTRSLSIGTEPEDIQKVRRKLEVLQETLKKQKTGK